MKRIVLFPYKMGSCGAKALAVELRSRGYPVLRVRDGSTKFVRRASDLILNWGNSRCRERGILNEAAAVAVAGSKLDFLQLVSGGDDGVPVPEWTVNAQEAQGWLDSGHTVVARTLLRASGGRGIVVCTTATGLVRAPLYTKYVKKAAEYRVHVFGDTVVDVQQKRRRAGVEQVDNQIRNYDRGWVFCREDVAAPDAVLAVAKLAVARCGLHFGAVDVIYNQHYDRAVVLEVNTAPGLEGTTTSKYAEAVEELL